MADNFKRFIDRNFTSEPSQVLPKFEDMLKKSKSTTLGVAKITRQIFEAAKANIPEAEHSKLAMIEGLISSLQTTSLRPVPKIKDSLFFPDPNSEVKLISYLDMAVSDMLVCVFTITNNHLRDALIRAHNRGVKLMIISDDECMKQIGSDVQFLRDAGIPTEIDTNPDAHMHNKFVIIDKEILVTGSFNWTIAAVNNNQENLVVLHDPEICAEYIKYFEGLWKSFRPVESERTAAAVKIQSNYRGARERQAIRK